MPHQPTTTVNPADVAAARILAAAGYPDTAACFTADRTTGPDGDVCTHCGCYVAGPFVGLTPAEVERMSHEDHELAEVGR